MIYLDNAGHLWPKPDAMYLQLGRGLVDPRRIDVPSVIAHVSTVVAGLLNYQHPNSVLLTRGASSALAWALEALIRPGDHVVTTEIEHDAVMSPLRQLVQKDINLTIVPGCTEGYVTVEAVLEAVHRDTRAIVMVHASNVSGALNPIEEIAASARARRILTIVDAAQTVGVYPIDLVSSNVDILAFSGQKGLFGPYGTGGLVAATRTLAEQLEAARHQAQLTEWSEPPPHMLLALKEGVDFSRELTVLAIRKHVVALTARLLEGLQSIPGVTVYGPQVAASRVGIVCFNVQGILPDQVRRQLEVDHEILCSSGLHHAVAVHKTLGTLPHGTVRFGIGWGTTEADINAAISAINTIATGTPRSSRVPSPVSPPRSVPVEKHELRLLLVPEVSLDHPIAYSDWGVLERFAQIEVMQVPDETYLLQGFETGVDLSRCLELAARYANQYDFVIGECAGGFLWRSIFRLAGDSTPFVMLPHFNHVPLQYAYIALLASALQMPSDIVFAGSNAASRSFSAFRFRCDSLYPLGVDLSRFRPASVPKASIRGVLGLPPEADILLYTGRLQEDKNVLGLLEAVYQVNSMHPVYLVICYHYHDDEYAALCQRRADSVGHVLFVHDPPPGQLVQYYQAADVFVSAAVSLFETFGRSPVEAMACGLPPIVPAYDGFRDTVALDCGILIPTIEREGQKAPDVTALSQAIRTALTDKTVLQSRRTACIQHALHFDRNSSLQSMLAKLRETTSTYVASSPALPRTLDLTDYPPELQTLWAPLQGRDIRELIADYLLSQHLPVEPATRDVEVWQRKWFEHY